MKCIWCHINKSPEDEWKMCEQCFKEMHKKKEYKKKAIKEETATEWMRKYLHLD